MAKAGSSLKPQVTMARLELDLALGKSAVSQAAIDELKAEAATLDARKSADQAPAASRLSPAAFAARTAAQYRSLRQAAEALNIWQSTLSRGLRDLEYQLGTVLFERTNGGTRPTIEGQELLETARRIVEETDGLPMARGRSRSYGLRSGIPCSSRPPLQLLRCCAVSRRGRSTAAR
jgi:Bacterial regulatory helix-turn-helix protein, lysR family